VGGGYSSFAIAEGLAFTLEQRREHEVAAAYDLQTGKEVWTNSWPGKFTEYYSEEGPRTTPEYSDGKVYALGALGKLLCLEAASGKTFWSHNVLADHGLGVPTYGCSSSPLIIGEKLIVVTTGGNGHSVICYDKRDGKLLWASLDDQMGYASPTLVTLADQSQIIVCGETQTFGLRPESGEPLWEYPWRVMQKQPVVAQPVAISTNRFLLSGGYFTGCAAVEVTKTGPGFTAATVYKNKFLKNKFTSSVYWQGYVYGLDEDILTCIEASTGERKWRDGRYGFGQVLLASGHLIVLAGNGDLALVKATPEGHQELCRFRAIKGKTWNHHAIGDGKLLVRNAVEMACFDISANQDATGKGEHSQTKP
jgi:outer membrane protein assembly factor BamB